MPTCKQCETKYSLWSDFGDGLCKPCHEKAVDEAARQAAERKTQAFADTKAIIDSLVRSMADEEPPVCVVFLNAGVQQISSGFFKKLPGLIGGLALGGPVGEMIFGGTLLANNATYAGELDILVVTPTRILIGYCSNTPFMSQVANIGPEHLQIMQAQCSSNALGRETGAISSSQISATDTRLTVVCGEKSMVFNRSELYVNGAIYPTPGLQEISKQANQLGTRATPATFVAQLNAGLNPLPDSQVDEAVGDATYMAALAKAIISHSHRDILFQKLINLAPSLKAALEQQLRVKAEAFQSTKVRLTVWTVLGVVSIVGVVLEEDFVSFLFVVGTIAALIGSITNLVNLFRSAWCRTVMKV